MEDIEESITGRIMGVREHGNKLIFFDLEGDEHKVQVMCNNLTYHDKTEFETLFSHIRRGDIIGITGTPGRTKAGELTHRAKKVVQLSYCLHQLPKDKAHGEVKQVAEHMLNKDTRYR